ncbi:MAG: carbonic anhydrase family protein [Chitinophagaceae bacterium]|nr:MAG: carbonic anhydrase family protein [Chitinophagaceae bacterium]
MKKTMFQPVRVNMISLTLVSLFLVTLNSCKKQESASLQTEKEFTVYEALKVSEENIGTKNNADDACAGVHYTYEGAEGPDNWSGLCEGWTACGQGQAQSPVNIEKAVHDKNLAPLDFRWTSTTAKIVNNGHTIQFNVDPGSKLIANNKTYDLIQFHYHHKSEHTIKDKYYPLEVHYVHSAPDGKLAVVGVMFKEGAPNNLFNMFLQDFPAPMTTYSSPISFNLASLLPKNLRYYNYQGSLTTPSCSEIVSWHVIKGTVTASKQQIDALKHLIHDNNRPLQALNGRTVKLSAGNGSAGDELED